MAPPPNNASMELVLHNSDLVREILQWVPAKSLVKFRSVCREWLFLIFSTAFKQQHTLRLKVQQQSLILQSTTLPRRWFHLNPSSRRLTSLCGLCRLPSEMIIVQSSNGLLLLQPKNWLRNEYPYVHNPATRQSRKIIPPPSTTHPTVLSVALVFNPSKSPYYELFCFRGSSSSPEEARIEVYSSKSHNWKELITSGPSNYLSNRRVFFIYVSRHRVRIYWNNNIYWSSQIVPNYYYFDIAKLVMKILLGPITKRGNGIKNSYWCLQESNGHLYHVELMESEGGRETMAMWELDDHHHWHERQRYVLPSTPPAPGVSWEPRSTRFILLVDTCSFLIGRHGWMRAYNLNTGTYQDFPDAAGQPFLNEGIQFRHTLALV